MLIWFEASVFRCSGNFLGVSILGISKTRFRLYNFVTALYTSSCAVVPVIKRPNPNSKRPNPNSKRPNPNSKRPNPNSKRPKRPNPNSKRPNPNSKRPNPNSKRPNPNSKRPNPNSKRPNPNSRWRRSRQVAEIAHANHGRLYGQHLPRRDAWRACLSS